VSPMECQNSYSSEEFNILFRRLINHENSELYPYQEKVTRSLLSGKNIILRAPTGAGKTWAALLPFFYALYKKKLFVDKVLYALPLRALASQLHRSTATSCLSAGWKVLTKPAAFGENDLTGSTITISIQTGEQQDDPFFQGDIIFTTIDQLLSSYILQPLSLPDRLANINAGALLGSLIVFDEFHLLDPDLSMGTAIEMMDRLSPFCRFLIMTATLSDNSIKWLSKHLGTFEIVDLEKLEIKLIEKKKESPTVRKWVYIDQPLTAERILQKHRHGQRTLVLVNTVKRAQQLYKAIERLKRFNNTNLQDVTVCLLHSRYFPEDRAIKEQQVISFLGKEQQKKAGNIIFISTQVVEAGMDFSVDVLHSELAPMNSLVQRAGRCVRYGGEGIIYIYNVENVAPYSAAIMEETSKVLKKISGMVLTFFEEKEAVNKVHGNSEVQKLQQYNNLYHQRQRICKAMDGLLSNAPVELIRDISSINVLVAAQPEKIRFDLPGQWPETLSVPLHSLRSFLNKAKNSNHSQSWIAKFPVFNGDESNHDQRWEWHDYNENTYPWFLVLNPHFAYYSADLGLVLGDSGTGEIREIKYRKRDPKASYHYRCETMSKHLSLVMGQFEKIKEKCLCSIKYLAAYLNISEQEVIKAVKLALLLHDTGKLTQDWERGAKTWQEYKTPGCIPSEPLAHTDYDPEKDWEIQKQFSRRPVHAVEGSFAVHQYLYDLFEEQPEIAACIFTAIARHHTGRASALKYFTLIPSAVEVLNRALQNAGFKPIRNILDKPGKSDCNIVGGFASQHMITAMQDPDWLPLYFFIVRQLRLSDQAGTMEGVNQ